MTDQNAQVDFIVRLFQTGMKKIEEITPKLESSLIDLQNHKANYTQFVDGVENLNLNRHNLEEFFSSTIEKLQKEIEGHTRLIAYTKNLLEQEKNEFAKLRESLNIEKEKISTLSKNQDRFVLQDDIENTKNKIVDLDKVIHDNNKTNQDLIAKITNEQTDLKDNQKQIKRFCGEVGINVANHNQELHNIKSKMEYDKKEYNDKQSKLLQDIRQMIDEAINAIPKPVIPSLDDVKKSFGQQLEPIMLDAKNASLRAVNNETKINILERKIDQLQLILNKIQMQG